MTNLRCEWCGNYDSCNSDNLCSHRCHSCMRYYCKQCYDEMISNPYNTCLKCYSVKIYLTCYHCFKSFDISQCKRCRACMNQYCDKCWNNNEHYKTHIECQI